MADETPEQIAERRIEEAARSGAKELDLTDLELRELPESIGRLTQLRDLHLGGDQLTALPGAGDRTTGTKRAGRPADVSSRRRIRLASHCGAEWGFGYLGLFVWRDGRRGDWEWRVAVHSASGCLRRAVYRQVRRREGRTNPGLDSEENPYASLRRRVAVEPGGGRERPQVLGQTAAQACATGVVCVGGWTAGEQSTAADLAGGEPTAGRGSESPPA